MGTAGIPMLRTTTANELAKILGMSRQAVEKTLKRHASRYVWRKGQGGSTKYYYANSLPEHYRLAIAGHDAIPKINIMTGAAAQVGVEAAESMLRERAIASEREQIAKEDGMAAFNKLPERRRKEAEARFALLQICDAFVKAAGFAFRRYAQRSKTGDIAFVEAYNSGLIAVSNEVRQIIGEKTSYSTVKRIADAYHKLGLAGLAFNYHNPKRGSTDLTEDQQNEIVKLMCRNPHTSTSNLRKGMQGRFGEDVPSASVIGRFRNRWINENKELWLLYTNPDEWKNKRMFAFGSASAHIERLNQLWEADSTPADLMLVDGRHSLIGMIDVYSRRLRLFVSKTSRATSVVALIRHCLIDWGVPEAIKTDNGKDYTSDHVVRVMHGLQINQILCTPFQGQEKPHIERAFRTFLHGLVEMMPNYIGHNVTERKAIEARRSFADRVMNKENEPVSVNMTAEALQKFCNEWTNFVYQHDAHGGLKGKKPIDMVRSWQEPIRRINDLRALDMLLMPAPSDGGTRTITKKGVQIDNRYYQSPEFAGHVGEKVFCLLDPADLGTVYLYLLNEHDERTFLCPAIDPEWLGIDPTGFANTARKHQEKLMREERRKLTKLCKEESQHLAYESYLQMRRDQVGNVLEFPGPSKEYTTPALGEAARAVLAKAELAEDERQVDQMFTKIEEEVAENSAKVMKLEEKVVILRSDADTYDQIRVQTKGRKRLLTRQEYDWLSEYYETNSGAMYRKMEGDLRETIGLAEAGQL
jgi:hypothetical protein